MVVSFNGVDLRNLSVGAPSAASKDTVRDYDQITMNTRSLIYFAEGQEGTIAVSDSTLARTLTINGLPQGGRFKLPPHYFLESTLVGLVPFVHVVEPKNAFLVGLGAGVTADWLVGMGLRQVKVAEIEPRVLDAVKVVFLGDTPVSDDAVDVHIGDARYLLLANAHGGGEHFDIITSMPAHPWVSSNLFTREFFELAKANLSSKGVFSTWFGTIKMDSAAVESLLRAFTSTFQHYVIYSIPEVGSYYLVGAEHQLKMDPRRIQRILRLSPFAVNEELKNPYFLPSRVFATGDADTPPLEMGIENTDNSPFVELRAPRVGKGTAPLARFLPREYLDPILIPSSYRKEFIAELLEQLLGTPGGRFPERERRTAPRRAERTLAAAKSLFTNEEVLYFRGRIALAMGHAENARQLFSKSRKGGTPIAVRSAKFAALTYDTGSQARLDALMSLEPTTDVLLELLDAEIETALDRVPNASSRSQKDPVGWFLWKATTSPVGRLSERDRADFLFRVGPRLLQVSRVGLLRTAEKFCIDHGLLEYADLLNARRRHVTALRVNRLTQVGFAAGNEGRFREAADALWRVHLLQPGTERIMQPLLRALVQIDDDGRIATVLEQFRFLGYSDGKLQVLLDAAEKDLLSFR